MEINRGLRKKSREVEESYEDDVSLACFKRRILDVSNTIHPSGK